MGFFAHILRHKSDLRAAVLHLFVAELLSVVVISSRLHMQSSCMAGAAFLTLHFDLVFIVAMQRRDNATMKLWGSDIP